MPIDVNEYLESCIKGGGPFEQDWSEMRNFYSRKLWHQLTLYLEKLIKKPSFKSSNDLQDIYNNFLKEFKHRINPLALAEIAIPISEQLMEKDPLKAIEFIEDIRDKHTTTCKEARILCNTTIGMVRLVKMNDLPGAREVIESTGAELESIDGVTSVHSRFYRMSSRYYQIMGKHAEYYREALRFLGCTDLSELDDKEKLQWALTVTLAALLGEGVYNFGELLTHDILSYLSASAEHGWLVQLLEAFNRGNLSKISELQQSPEWFKQPDLVAAASSETSLLREKATLLGLVEAIFQRPANDRSVSFADISAATGRPIDKVEHLVMRALSLGLMKGRIDEVRQVVTLTWLQPRVLDREQIADMHSRLKAWSQTVIKMRDLVEVDAKAILA